MVSLMYSAATYAGNSVLNSVQPRLQQFVVPRLLQDGLLLWNFSMVLHRDLLGTL